MSQMTQFYVLTHFHVLGYCLESLRSVMFGATFNLVTRVGLPYFFGTMKDGLEINSIALNNCFSNRNVFQNGVTILSKMV